MNSIHTTIHPVWKWAPVGSPSVVDSSVIKTIPVPVSSGGGPSQGEFVIRKLSTASGNANAADTTQVSYVIEYTKNGAVHHSIETSGIHGSIYTDGYFESFSITRKRRVQRDGQCPWVLMYIAETPRTAGKSFFDPTFHDEPDKLEADPTVGRMYEWKDSWGEAYNGLAEPAIFVYDPAIDNISRLQAQRTLPPGQKSFGQGMAVWGHDGITDGHEPTVDDGSDRDKSVPILPPIVYVDFLSTLPDTTIRLGVKYCINRPSSICLASPLLLQTQERAKPGFTYNATDYWPHPMITVIASPAGQTLYSCRSPRVLSRVNGTSCLVFLATLHSHMPTHFGPSGLYRAELPAALPLEDNTAVICSVTVLPPAPANHPSGGEGVIDDTDNGEATSLHPDYQGLYTLNLLPNPFFAQRFVAINTQEKSWIPLRFIDLDSGALFTTCTSLAREIDSEGEEYDVDDDNAMNKGTLQGIKYRHPMALDICDDKILVAYSSYTQPSSISVLVSDCIDFATHSVNFFEERSTFNNDILQHVCRKEPALASRFQLPHARVQEADWGFYLCPHRASSTGGDDDDVTSDTTPPPTIVIPHGGPHSAWNERFNVIFATLFYCGYRVILVNYQGSAGFAVNQLQRLPGLVGRLDVQDVRRITEIVHQPPSPLCILGGSHGGFLAAHLVSQYPDDYRAAVMRNPVTDIATMVMTSDIPDWCLVEAGVARTREDLTRLHDLTQRPEYLRTLWERSPLQYAGAITAPILLALGRNDLRVPRQQGLELLRHATNAKEVMVREYDDDHPLGKPETEGDFVINSVLFFARHCHWDLVHNEYQDE